MSVDKIAKWSLYFAFPDGVFDYICAECSALCCRGQGFGGSLQREMSTLLKTYPKLNSMAVSRCGDVVHFTTPTGRCFFLENDGLCRIEKTHGKSLKPGVCNLFPFNVFHRLGNTITISPHFMCPLRVSAPARPGKVEGSHQKIATSLQESAFLQGVYAETQITSVTWNKKQQKPKEILLQEQEFLSACSQALGTQKFYDVLQENSSDSKKIEHFLDRASKILHVSLPKHSKKADQIDTLLFAMSPSLRLGLLSLGKEGMLRVLALGEVLIRHTAPLCSQPMKPQEAHQIFTSSLSMLRLLALEDSSLKLPTRVNEKVPPFGEPQLTFAAFITLREIRGGTGVLSALEKSIPAALSPVDRSAFLHSLGAQIEKDLSGRQRR